MKCNVSDIRRLDPCYDPVMGVTPEGDEIHPGGFVDENWEGTLLDILEMKEVPPGDRVWVVLMLLRHDEDRLRRFAVKVLRVLEEIVPEVLPGAANTLEAHLDGKIDNLDGLRERALGLPAFPLAELFPVVFIRQFTLVATDDLPNVQYFWSLCVDLSEGIPKSETLETEEDVWGKLVEILKEVSG